MEKNTSTKIGIGLLIVGVLGFTGHYLWKQYKLLMDALFEFEKFKVNKMSFDNINLTLLWKIYNPSDISITVSEQEYDIYLDDQFLKKVGYASPVKISSKKESFLPTYIDVTREDIKKIGTANIAKLLTSSGRESLTMLIKGQFTIKTNIFTIRKIQFEYETNLEELWLDMKA